MISNINSACLGDIPIHLVTVEKIYIRYIIAHINRDSYPIIFMCKFLSHFHLKTRKLVKQRISDGDPQLARFK